MVKQLSVVTPLTMLRLIILDPAQESAYCLPKGRKRKAEKVKACERN